MHNSENLQSSIARVNLNFVRAKHFGSKSLVITNKLSAVMLRPTNIFAKQSSPDRYYTAGAIYTKTAVSKSDVDELKFSPF